MKIVKMLYLIYLVFLVNACCKDEVCPPPDPCEEVPCNDTIHLMGKLDTLWTNILKSDNSNTGIQEDLEYKSGKLIATFSSALHGSIVSYNVDSIGEILWEYNQGDRRYNNSFILTDLRLIVNKNWANRLSVDLITGEGLEYETSSAQSGPRGIVLGDYMYYDETEDNERTVHLRRSPVTRLSEVETIYTLDNDQIDNSKKSIESMNLWIHPDTGDSILIFQHRMLDRVDVVAWNMDKREVVWRHDDLTRLGNSNHQQIVIHEGKAYFGGATAFYCFDMSSGEILWQFDHPSGINSFMLYSPVIAEQEGIIVVKDAGGEFRGFDLMNGSVRMFSTGSGFSTVTSGSPIYHKGIVYFTEKSLLYAIRASNGQTLWEESSSRIPMGRTSFQGELAIDPERGILYATDDDELFAIKVYED